MTRDDDVFRVSNFFFLVNEASSCFCPGESRLLKSALRRASLDVSGIFRRNRHSSGVPSPSPPFIRRAEPQHEKLRL